MSTPHPSDSHVDPPGPVPPSARHSYGDGDRIHDRFTIRSFEGAGALGERYLAFDEEVDVVVALRVVHADLLPNEAARRQFRERMQRARSLSHPSLLRVYAVVEHEGRQVLAVQHAPGRSLDVKTPAGTMTSFVEARPLLGQVAAALAHAHHLGIVLGDVRPSTVMLLAEGVKVTSVGVALALPRDRYLAALKNHPELYHLAPELRHGDPCDARADVFSLAALAMSMLAGSDVTSARAGLRPDLPAPLVAALNRAFEADPGKRYATVEALLSAMDRGAQSSKRGGPVTLPASMSGLGGLIEKGEKGEKGEKNDQSGQSYKDTQAPAARGAPSLRAFGPVSVGSGDARRDVTRQVDEEELKRLAGEVSELLETTRQVSIDEILPLRAQAADTTRGGEDREGASRVPVPVGREPSQRRRDDREGASRVPVPVGREPSQRRRDERPNATFRERSVPVVAAGRRGLIEENDDLEFDLSPTIRIEKVDEATFVNGSVAALPTADDWLSASDAGSQPVTAAEGPAGDPPAALDPSRPPQPRAELRFQPTTDPFSAALEAANDESPFLLTIGHRRSGPDDAGDDDSASGVMPTTPASAPPFPPSEAAPAGHPVDRETSGIVAEPHFETARGRATDDRARSDSAAPPSTPARAQRPTAPVSFPDSVFIVAPQPANLSAPPARPASTAPTMPAVAAGVLVAAAAASEPAKPRRPKQPRTDGRLIIIGGICSALALAALVALAVRFTRENEPLPLPVSPPGIAPSAPLGSSPRPTTPPKSAPPLLAVGTTAIAPAVAAVVPAPTGATTSVPTTVAASALVPGCPAGMVRLDGAAAACIDSHEFPGAGQLPRTGVSLVEAGKLCAERSARLCTAREWERACRGAGGASYPYGQRYLPETCNTDGTMLKPSGALEGCRSRVGAFDMSGNAAEWTVSGIIKGGAAGQGNPAGRCSSDQRGGQVGMDLLGFRCCADSH